MKRTICYATTALALGLVVYNAQAAGLTRDFKLVNNSGKNMYYKLQTKDFTTESREVKPGGSSQDSTVPDVVGEATVLYLSENQSGDPILSKYTFASAAYSKIHVEIAKDGKLKLSKGVKGNVQSFTTG